MKCNRSDIINSLIHNKQFWLGIAMLLILLYHMPRISYAFKVFDPLFIGVDLFLFFSGYSLCYSYESHNLGTFYKRRFLRIYPMYFTLAIIVSLVDAILTGKISLVDILCNITSLSYYRIGGRFIDWYLSSLFIFYLLFPLLYLLTKRFRWVFPVLMTVVTCVFVSGFDIHWWYGCAIGRLPIFSLGIFCFLDRSNNKQSFINCCFFYFFMFIVAVILYKTDSYMRGYFLTDMITPLLLLFIALCICKLPGLLQSSIGRGISIMGRYSLEIYCANVITMELVYNILMSYEINAWIILAAYFSINTILALLLIQLDYLFHSFIK